MQIKRIIILILILFLISGCTSSTSNTENIGDDTGDITNDSPYIEPVSETDAVYNLSDDTNKLLSNYFGEPADAFIGESLSLIGKTIDFYDLQGKDLYGNDVDFSKYKDKKVLVEIAATYCNHCGEQLKYISRIKNNLKDIDILQIFADTNGNPEYIKMFYADNDHKIEDDVTIIQFNHELTERFMDVGITQTPTFMFIDSGVIKTALSSFNSKFLDKICEIGFTDTIKREDINDPSGRTIDEFYRTAGIILNELKTEDKDYLNSLYQYNAELTANVAGNKFNYNDLSVDFNSLIKKDSYDEYDNKNTIIFGLWRDDTSNLEMDIRIINDFLDNNKDINGLIVFIDDTERFLTSTSDLYNLSKEKANCPIVSSEASIPQQVRDILENYIYSEEIPMILFIEKNYITGLCGGPYSLNSLDKLKDMYFGPNCITLKENLNRNY